MPNGEKSIEDYLRELLGEEPEEQLPVTPRPPVEPIEAPRPVVEPPLEQPTIPLEGEQFNVEIDGKPTEFHLQEDFEFVGTERRLKSQDFVVYSEGKEVGRYIGGTGEFIPKELTFWEKAIGVGVKALQWGFVLPTLIGISSKYPQHDAVGIAKELAFDKLRKHYDANVPKSLYPDFYDYYISDGGAQHYLKLQKDLSFEAERLEKNWGKEALPGGELYKRYQELPVGEQLLRESPFWLYLGLTGTSALKARAALQAAKVGKPLAVRVALEAAKVPLAPVAGYEWVIGKTTQIAYTKLMSTVLRRNLHSWATSAGIKIPKATEDAFIKSAVRQLSPKFMTKEFIKTLFQPTKAGFTVTGAGATAAETAAAQAVKTSPLLLGTGKAAVSPATLKAIVIPTITPPVTPTITPPPVAPIAEVTPTPVAEARIPSVVTSTMIQQLIDLGYTPEAIVRKTPAIAQGIIAAGTKAPIAKVAPTVSEVTEFYKELIDWFGVAKPGDNILGILPDGTTIKAEGLGAFQHRGVGTTTMWLDAGVIRVVPEEGGNVSIEIKGGITTVQEEGLVKLVQDTDGFIRIDFEDRAGRTIQSFEGLRQDIRESLNTYLVKVKPPAEVARPPVEPVAPPELVVALVETPNIPKELPTTPPTLPPEAVTLGRTENEWVGFMADLQSAQTVADIAFRDDTVRRWIKLLPETHAFFRTLNPSAIANTPAEQAIIVRAVLRDEGLQKSQGVISFINELGSQEKIFGNLDDKGLIKSGTLMGQSLGDIAEHRSRWEGKLTDAQKVWLDRAKIVEDSIIEFLERNGIEVAQLRLEEGGQFATRRVWARTLKNGDVIDTAYVSAGPARPGARLPTEKHRLFKTEADAIAAGYRYLPYEESLYLKLSGAYNRVADKQMVDWLLNQVPWRTTGAPEELILAAEQATLKKRHSQMLLSALNRAVRGERVPDVTINAIATSYPDQAQKLRDLIPRIQRGEPTARDVQNLTRVAKGLISSDKATSQRAINARARARERALSTKYGEATVPAPAFAGKILTGPEAKETALALRKAFDPSFSKALGEVNKANAVARYFMLAGDFSPFTIQLLFLIGENPIIYGKAFGGAMRALFSPEFHSSYLLKHKATIDKHPNLLLTKSGGTEFTEAMARGGWLSGKTALIPQAESYWKSLGLFLPRTLGKVGATVLTPFQRVFESALDIAGIEMAEAYDYLATTPERTADVDQFINEFRGLTSSARIGVSVQQRQIETSLILAPRYNRAIAGLLYDLGRGGIRGSLARTSLAKGIAAIVALAAIISIARGESLEEILDHYNPRSSNFFTWDVAGQKVGPGTKIRSVVKLFAQSTDNPDSLFQFSMDNPALRFLRGNLSPVVSSGLDLITGRSYIGDPTRDGMLSFSKEIIAGNLLPIWVQSVLLEGGDVKGRTIRGIAEFFGGRAYPESVWNEVGRLRDTYSMQDFKIKYEDLNRMQIDRLRDNHPDLKDLEGKARLEGVARGTEEEQWIFATREQIIKERNDALERAAVAVNAGLMSNYDYDKERGYARPYYSGGMSVLWLAQESLDPFSMKQLEKWIGENQKPEDKAVDDYQKFRADLIQKADLPKDWDKIEKQSEAYLSRFSKSMRDYIKANVNRWINDLPENAKQLELIRLAGIEDETWWDDYRGESQATPKVTPAETPAEKSIEDYLDELLKP